MASKRSAPEGRPKDASLGAQMVSTANDPAKLTPAARAGRGGGMQGLIEEEKNDETTVPEIERAPKTRRRGPESKSEYWKFVSAPSERSGKKGHECLLRVTSANRQHGGAKHPTWIGSTDITNIKGHFDTWHHAVSV
jgi:hypothetical protein